MKKSIIYALLLIAAFVLPIQGVDVGKLLPVELVQIYREENAVVIATDAGESGVGASVEDAIENLKSTTTGIIFLDTADFLLIDETAQEEAPELAKHLKQSVRVCYSDTDIDLKAAAEFLSIHKPKVRLGDQQHSDEAQILTKENGRILLKDK